METIKAISAVAWGLMPIFIWMWLWMLGRDIKALNDTIWINQFEVKDILRDIKMNTVRNRELLTEGEVFNVDEAKR